MRLHLMRGPTLPSTRRPVAMPPVLLSLVSLRVNTTSSKPHCATIFTTSALFPRPRPLKTLFMPMHPQPTGTTWLPLPASLLLLRPITWTSAGTRTWLLTSWVCSSWLFSTTIARQWLATAGVWSMNPIVVQVPTSCTTLRSTRIPTILMMT